MSIYKKLSNVQSELKAPKSQYNSFGNYKFRSCEDITEAVKPLLAKEGLIMTMNDELKLIGDRYYIEATVTVIDTETSEKHEVNAYAREAKDKKGMDVSQITGASSSYARKYALNGMFAIDDTKDSDVTNKHGKDNNTADIKKDDTISDKTKKKIDKLIDKAHKKAGDGYTKKKVENLAYKDFAKKKGWKKFFIGSKTSEKAAQEFVEYMEKRLGDK